MGLPGWFSSKDSVCRARDAGDAGLIPWWRRTHKVRNGNTLSACLGNPWTKELGELQSKASQRAVHDLATEHEHLILYHYVKSRNIYIYTVFNLTSILRPLYLY